MKTRLSFALLSCTAAIISTGFSSRVCAAEAPSGAVVAWTPEKARSANAAIMAYLGEPLPPPAELDPKYTAEGLVAACKAACANLGFELSQLDVDDTEFPFLVHGVITGSHDFKDMPGILRTLPGYAYGGSVVGRKNGMTFFSLNLISPEQYPRGQRAAIQRRLMIRLQMLGELRSDSIP